MASKKKEERDSDRAYQSASVGPDVVIPRCRCGGNFHTVKTMPFPGRPETVMQGRLVRRVSTRYYRCQVCGYSSYRAVWEEVHAAKA